LLKMWNRLKLTMNTNLFCWNNSFCLGFWIGKNSWESRWRNSKYLWFKMNKNEIQWKITQHDKKLCDCFRHKVELVQFVGWLLSQLHTEITAKNQMFGHLELLVCEFSQFSFHFTIWCDIFVLMSSFTSIIEKFVCLFSLWNCCTMWTSQRQRCDWCCN
jgi:hypothetical protein